MTWWLAPDLSGRRLAAIRAARRGSLIALVTFLPVAGLSLTAFGAPDLGFVGLLIILVVAPGVALLGAGLTATALGSRAEAVLAGAAAGVGLPLAATIPLVVVAAIVGGLAGGSTGLGRATGWVIEESVLASARVAPLVVLAVVGWVGLVRRFARSVPRPVAGALFDGDDGDVALASPASPEPQDGDDDDR